MKEKLIKRFFEYLSIPSQSNANNQSLPSSEEQYELAKNLKMSN